MNLHFQKAPEMTVNRFFDLFLEELKSNSEMTEYYKFLNDTQSFEFRKSYFLQRLTYVKDQLPCVNDSYKVIDIGCGYGTTAIFLALNGYKIDGLTLEFYFDQIEKRMKYWSQYGDLSKLYIRYEDLFDEKIQKHSYNSIIIQDTLHHLEPVDKALQIMKSLLTDDGQIIIVEENGQNIISRVRLYMYRGNKRIKEIYDEKLKKTYFIGDENTRSLTNWVKILQRNGLSINHSKTQYIRYYFPVCFRFVTAQRLLAREQSIWQKSTMRRKYLYFGLNFTAQKG